MLQLLSKRYRQSGSSAKREPKTCNEFEYTATNPHAEVDCPIDVHELANLAHTGVRRAVLFMGLGLNAAHREEFRDYQLHKLPILPDQTGLPVEFFSSDLPLERVDEFKKEFAVW